MRPPRSSHKACFAALAASLPCLATACHADEAVVADGGSDRPELGLMGTIPIYWGEAGDFGELVAGGQDAHWARTRLEADYRLSPLDTLDEASLAGIDFLMLAQPRALSPAENVALDAWVRGGGKLLLFADPMLTGESRFAIGDRRRPQDVILLSPILDHWGLALAFDEDRPAGPVLIPAVGTPIPVNLPGSLEVGDGEAACALLAANVLAECRIDRGSALVLADAALLDLHGPPPGAGEALDWLTGRAFAMKGETTGQGLPIRKSDQ
jgi:hypothetical protein